MGFIGSFLKAIGDILHELFTGGWLEIALGVFLVALLGGIVWLACYGAYYAADSWFLPVTVKPGLISGIHHSPAHYQNITTTGADGAVMAIPQYIPESWSISVIVDGKRGSKRVSKEYHKDAVFRQAVLVHFATGRLSGKVYVKGLS